LLLGSSETIGTAAELFATSDKKNKIYTKKSTPLPPRRDFQEASVQSPFISPTPAAPENLLTRTLKPVDPVAEAERLVLERYAPAWVLVNQALDVVQFKGATGTYIEPASGQPTWNLMRMLRPGLTPDVRMLIHSALKEGSPIRKDGIKVQTKGLEHTVDIEVSPIAGTHCLVLFMEKASVRTNRPAKTTTAKTKTEALSPKDHQIAVLKDDLIQTQKSLQSIIEEQNANTEEMQSANEEVLSANEELQSTNEELETAKEELQSTNE
jgi:two-component system CheB/CheR fusion protein